VLPAADCYLAFFFLFGRVPLKVALLPGAPHHPDHRPEDDWLGGGSTVLGETPEQALPYCCLCICLWNPTVRSALWPVATCRKQKLPHSACGWFVKVYAGMVAAQPSMTQNLL